MTVTERCELTYKQKEGDEWEPEMHQSETATESAWNTSELRDSWEQVSWDETRTWEDEGDQFEGSFADEDEEEAFNLAETQLNEALDSERNARRTVAQARAIMHDIKSSRGGYYPQGANKKGSEAGKGKGKGHGKNRDSRGRVIGQSSKTSTSQAGMRLHKPTPPSARPCLKCGSRDHEAGKCPKNQEHRSYMAQALNFTAWCLGSDETNSTSVEAFSCENLARGRVLIDCGATDTVGSVEAIEAIIDKSQEAFGNDHDWVSVDVNDRPIYKPETVVQLDQSPTGHLWMDLFEQMPVVSESPLSLLGHVKTRANVG